MWKLRVSAYAACAAFIGATAAAQEGTALPGRLAYIHDGVVVVVVGRIRADVATLPMSNGAISVSLSPSADGGVVFFAPRVSKAGPVGSAGDYQAFASRPPYATTAPLPIFRGKDDDTSVTWTVDGKADIAIGDLKTKRVDPKNSKVATVDDGSNTVGHSASGVMLAYTDGDGRVVVRSSVGGPEKVLFSPASPTALLAAFKRAHAPAKLKELNDEMDAMLLKDPHKWSVGNPALTPDHKTIFFAANMGTGMGAQGNTNFCLFAADIRTGSIAVLSKAGGFFGRAPIDCAVSPDGHRLFFATSVHSSAADNSFLAYVLDLPTQQVRELLRSDTRHAKEANLMDSWCWSPDGRDVAISALYYDPKTVADSDPDMRKSTLFIDDAATGKELREIPHARSVQWSQY